ncbi:MAG: 1-acyl-sn-glycerol-3-phosphate acyltransferase [Prevotella sp.]|nr:1-acyl-sn-glycerol-3-phosphate acyltransferase [Prevotella sp.]
MVRRIAAFILKIFGWKITGTTDYPAKCVICVAPHTSNWDLFWGQIVYLSLGRKAHFLIKKSWFFFPMNLFFRAIGGISVDRSKKNAMTELLISEFARRRKFHLAITPEGTRKRTKKWKQGFYYIALAAQVPIVIAALDYGDRIIDFKKVFYPTGDAGKDIPEIIGYYKETVARHPERFDLPDEPAE